MASSPFGNIELFVVDYVDVTYTASASLSAVDIPQKPGYKPAGIVGYAARYYVAGGLALYELWCDLSTSPEQVKVKWDGNLPSGTGVRAYILYIRNIA